MAKNEEPTQFITLTAEQFAQLVGTRQDSDEFLKKQAEYQAKANKQVLRPENEFSPEISVFNPLGERDHPKPELHCKMYWNGFPLEKDALTPEEVSLLNQCQKVGDFPFHRTDGSLDHCTITGDRDANGKLTKLEFTFRAKGDYKHNLPSMVGMLRDMLGLESVEDELRKRIAELEAIVA